MPTWLSIDYACVLHVLAQVQLAGGEFLDVARRNPLMAHPHASLLTAWFDAESPWLGPR